MLIWIAATLSVFLGISGIILDANRKRMIVAELQRVANSASVSAAAELDGTRQGWTRAKRAAVSLLRSHSIPGVGDFSDATVVFNEGDPTLSPDALEDDPLLKKVTASLGKFDIRIERGVYWSGDQEEFISLEGRKPTEIKDSSGRNLPMFKTLPVYILANAVKVSFEARGVSRIFSRLFSKEPNSEYFSPISAHATAANDFRNEECVIPAAIPACALMLEMAPQAQQMYETESYQADRQCQRETVISEANPMGPAGFGYYLERGDGILRSQLYPAFPRIGGMVNKKGIPLWGVLGTPDEELASRKEADPNLLVSMIRDGCRRVRLGARFRPLENGVGLGGVYKTRGEEISNHLRMTLAKLRTDQPFVSVFGDPSIPETIKPNYPWRRQAPEELMQDFRADNDKTVRIYLDPPARSGDWLNPMCHDWEGGPPNDPNAGVAEVMIMVIAPSESNYTTNAGAYCDFKSVFGGLQANTTAPLAQTNPVVVGFVKAKLFDFNFKDYGSVGSPNFNFDKSPSQYAFLKTSMIIEAEKNSEELPGENDILTDEEISSAATDFIDEHQDWQVCHNNREECIRLAGGPGSSDARDCPKCGRQPEMSDKLKRTLRHYSEAAKYPAECVERLQGTDDESYQDILTELSNNGCSGRVRCDDPAVINLLKDIKKYKIDAAQPQRYCIPERKPNCTDSHQSGCYQGLLARAPQWGCGGLRVRLDCQQPSLASTRFKDERVATLIK